MHVPTICLGSPSGRMTAPLASLPLPSLSDEARAFVAGTIAQAAAVAGRPVECVFVGPWSRERRQMTGARLMSWGSPERAMLFSRDCQPGEIVVHSHACGPLIPSQADLECANNLDTFCNGFGIVDETGQRLFVVREPRPVPADLPRSRGFMLGPWWVSIMRLPR
jgi:hypothetical protein